MRRLSAVLAVLAVLAAAPAADAASWADPQIRVAVESGLMGPSVERFRPNDPLTRAELAQIVAGITRRQQLVAHPRWAVWLRRLDAALVGALGLGPAAREVRAELVDAGLAPPRSAGTEIVARLLRLRYNHPAPHDGRELRPRDPVTRAEAAYSVARVLQLSESDLVSVNERALSFEVPTLTYWQRRVLARAVRFVGFPYIWGGTSEWPQTLFGVSSRGGFDCSGFVWRVYKLAPFSEGPALGTTIVGRTTYEISGERPQSERIALQSLRPADLVFFGDVGPLSRPAEIRHMAMYLGGGWFIHSSSQGTTLTPLEGWYQTRFAWGRRPLAEVGLG